MKWNAAKLFGLMIAVVVIGIAVLLVVIGPRVDSRMNAVHEAPPYQVDTDTIDLQRRLIVADLHADPLLWRRNLLARHDYGHVDLPRMRDGGLDMQVFGVVTKTPRNMNFESNPSDSDNITTLAVLQAWPPRTWGSLLQRALYQAQRLDTFITESNGAMQWVRNRPELAAWLDGQYAGAPAVAGLLGLEGAHALEGQLDNLERLYAAGFRMIGLAHFFDNEFAGSAHGVEKHGLTDLGRRLVVDAQARGMLVDIAHSSPQTIADVLDITNAPLVASHTGVRGTCNKTRNLSDAQLDGIAATGGVIAIAMFEEAVCGKDVAATARAMRYAANRVGVAHIALGADFDGAVMTPVDVSGLPQLTAAMRDAGFDGDQIAAILGGNFIRLLAATLPTE